jgi:hypothetical protein
MSPSQIANYLLTWGLTGAFTFNLFVIYLFRSGRVYDGPTKQGHIREDLPRKGLATMLVFLLAVVGFFILTNYLSLVRTGAEMKFWPVFGLNLALIVVLVVYDSLVIDWWVIAFWRPTILKLPDEMDRTQMAVHLRRTLVVAPPISLAIALLSAAGTVLIW